MLWTAPSFRSPLLPSLASPLMTALLAVVPAAAEEARLPDRAPVLLRDTLLTPPPESAGTGLAPEVKVKVEVDRRGAVAAVGVLAIDSLGETLDAEMEAIFRSHTREALETWRWAPAIENGEAVPKTLEWTVKYRPKTGRFTEGSRPRLEQMPVQLRLTETFARRDRLASLPMDRQQELLLRYSRLAEAHMDPERRNQFDSPRFVVVTDADDEGSAEAIARILEAAIRVVQGMHQPTIEPHPRYLKTLVYLYKYRTDFEAARADLTPLCGMEATYYAPGLIIYHLEVGSPDILLSFLIHEASHAYSDQHLRGPRIEPPRWFEEGFAEYMGNSKLEKGKLIPGATLKRKYVLSHFSGGAHLSTTQAGWDLDTAQKALRRKGGMDLFQVVDAKRTEFYGRDSHLYYSISWLFVHFLRHGEQGWDEGPFSTLVLYLAEGYSSRSAIEAAYGRTLEELEGPFLEYVRKI
ncbi:MAG: hypothetical protein MI919_03175 [Holophagales bacterium]|nr:hypothetical protein [Holophagales bacterium]